MKASPILLYATGDMRHLPESERAALRRLFTQHFQGSDGQQQRRLVRLVGDMLRARAGEGFQLYRAEERSGPFHRYHRAVIASLFERQERYPRQSAMHDWLKLKCWFVEWVDGAPKPRSTDYDSCSEDEIREFNTALKALLHEPDVQAHFWRHLSVRLRMENVTQILTNPKDPHEQ